MLESYGLTDVGRLRPQNEDRYVIDDEASFFAVCDGLGGQNAGEVASSLAVEAMAAFVRKSHRDREITWPYGVTARLSYDGNRLLTAICLANTKVFRAADGRPDYTGLGTTVVAALVRDGVLTIGWVGDSRAYLIRRGSIAQLTEDHTWINMAGREGLFSPEELAKHAWKHVLTRAVGGRESVEVDIVERPLEAGDLLLLCSDGLHAMLGDQAILAVLERSPASLEGAVRALIDAANEAGGKDNVSAILVRHAEGGSRPI